MNTATAPGQAGATAPVAGYAAYHAPRYAFVLGLLADRGVGTATRLLDIGPSSLTGLMRARFGAPVDSLGYWREDAPDGMRHFDFDLNLAQEQATWRRDLPRYDGVVMAEVLEHLYTAPELVLRFVRTLVADDGWLLLQTPNAASLPKRLKLLAGRNPYEMIRVDRRDPGHFREYTVAELRRLAEAAGFRVEACHTAYYFDARHGRHGPGGRPQPWVGLAKNLFYRSLPAGLREGITMLLRPSAGPATVPEPTPGP